MNFLDLIPSAIKVIGKALGISNKVKEVVDAIEGAPPEVRAQIARDLQQHEQAMKALGVEEMRVVFAESIVQAQSSDKFTSRARPALLYLAGFITAGMAGALIFGVKLDTGAIVSLLTPLWGNAAWYTYNRTKEKMNGHNGD